MQVSEEDFARCYAAFKACEGGWEPSLRAALATLPDPQPAPIPGEAVRALLQEIRGLYRDQCFSVEWYEGRLESALRADGLASAESAPRFQVTLDEVSEAWDSIRDGQNVFPGLVEQLNAVLARRPATDEAEALNCCEITHDRAWAAGESRSKQRIADLESQLAAEKAFRDREVLEEANNIGRWRAMHAKAVKERDEALAQLTAERQGPVPAGRTEPVVINEVLATRLRNAFMKPKATMYTALVEVFSGNRASVSVPQGEPYAGPFTPEREAVLRAKPAHYCVHEVFPLLDQLRVDLESARRGVANREASIKLIEEARDRYAAEASGLRAELEKTRAELEACKVANEQLSDLVCCTQDALGGYRAWLMDGPLDHAVGRLREQHEALQALVERIRAYANANVLPALRALLKPAPAEAWSKAAAVALNVDDVLDSPAEAEPLRVVTVPVLPTDPAAETDVDRLIRDARAVQHPPPEVEPVPSSPTGRAARSTRRVLLRCCGEWGRVMDDMERLERIRRHEMIDDELRLLIEERFRCARWPAPKPQARAALLADIIVLLSPQPQRRRHA